MKTIEQLAEEAGLNWSEMSGVFDRAPIELVRFAALVAERCAAVVKAGAEDAERHSGAEAAGHLDAAAYRIRAEFPKP